METGQSTPEPERRTACYVHPSSHDGDYSWNPNNYVDGDACRIRPRK